MTKPTVPPGAFSVSNPVTFWLLAAVIPSIETLAPPVVFSVNPPEVVMLASSAPVSDQDRLARRPTRWFRRREAVIEMTPDPLLIDPPAIVMSAAVMLTGPFAAEVFKAPPMVRSSVPVLFGSAFRVAPARR